MKFNGALNLHQQFDTACTRHLRQQVEARLENAQIKLSSSDTFKAAAQPKKVDEFFSAMASMLFIGAVLHGAEQMLSNYTGLDLDFMPAGTIASAVDFCIDLRDDMTEGRFKNSVAGYPEGRRKGLFEAPKPRKSFNLVCSNDHSRFDMENDHEVRTMSDLLEALKTIEKKGMTELNIKEGQTVKQAVYAALRQPTAKASHNFFKPLALAA